MNLVVAFLVLFGLACTGTPRVAPPKAESPVTTAISRTEFLEEAHCTGVRMGAGLLVTAKHCVDDGAAPGDAFEGGVLIHVSPDHDFVVAKREPAAGVPITLRPARLGEHVYVVGYPVQLGSGEQELTVTDGIVAGPVDDDKQARITAPVYFGNSGGGVWADDGSLVGIAVSIYAVRVDGYNRPVPYVAQSFMVPVEYVIAALP